MFYGLLQVEREVAVHVGHSESKTVCTKHIMGHIIEALCYNPDECSFDSKCHGIF
jgi:hypothetical protein